MVSSAGGTTRPSSDAVGALINVGVEGGTPVQIYYRVVSTRPCVSACQPAARFVDRAIHHGFIVRRMSMISPVTTQLAVGQPSGLSSPVCPRWSRQ
jgi:hypothetical protein